MNADGAGKPAMIPDSRHHSNALRQTCRRPFYKESLRMDVWHYKGRDDLHALTSDEDGANLPAELGPWTLVGVAELLDRGEDEQDAALLVNEHGYCCFE